VDNACNLDHPGERFAKRDVSQGTKDVRKKGERSTEKRIFKGGEKNRSIVVRQTEGDPQSEKEKRHFQDIARANRIKEAPYHKSSRKG